MQSGNNRLNKRIKNALKCFSFLQYEIQNFELVLFHALLAFKVCYKTYTQVVNDVCIIYICLIFMHVMSPEAYNGLF
jgi:diacylglycerol kinase